MNHYRSDKGRQVVFGVDPKHPMTVLYLGSLNRGKNQTAETALREWAETAEVALDSDELICVAATIDTDRYRVTVRKVADIEVVTDGRLEFPMASLPDPSEPPPEE